MFFFFKCNLSELQYFYGRNAEVFSVYQIQYCQGDAVQAQWKYFILFFSSKHWRLRLGVWQLSVDSVDSVDTLVGQYLTLSTL